MQILESFGRKVYQRTIYLSCAWLLVYETLLDLVLKNFLLIRIFEDSLAEGTWESSLDSCLDFSVIGNGSPYGKNQLWKQAWIQISTLLPTVCVLMWVQLKGCS